MSMPHHGRHRAILVVWVVLLVGAGTACGRGVEDAVRTPTPVARLNLPVLSGQADSPVPTPGVEPGVSPLTSPLSPRPTPTMNAGAAMPFADLAPLAYVDHGDVWVFAQGEARRITGGGNSSTPRWSPSRRWLAFLNGNTLVVVDMNDGRIHTQVEVVNRFAWSPVDDHLAYVAGSGILRLAVLRVAAAGDEETMLIPPEVGATGVLGAMAWSPDGQWLAYEWAQGTAYHGIWRVPAAGGDPVELYASGVPDRGPALLAGWTADAQHLLFWQGPVLSTSALAGGVPVYALPLQGGDPLRIADTVLYRDGFVAPNPRRADQVACVLGGGRGTWWNKALVSVNLSGLGHLMSAEGQAALWPAWSPDGTRLAYVVMPDDGDLVGGDTARAGMMRRHVWTITADGSDRRQLTRDPAYRDEYPRWSSDGSHLLFARMDEMGNASLWLVPAVGGEPVQVADQIGPVPGPAEPWFGYYGYIEWGSLFDW